MNLLDLTLYGIIGITALVSLLCFKNISLFNTLKFNAYSIVHEKDYKRMLTYGFVHADYIHLFFNMFVLYSFSNTILDAYGSVWGNLAPLVIVFFYLTAIIASTLADVSLHKDNPAYNAVGASGAVSAFVFAAILLFPQGRVAFIFIPIGIPSPLFGIAYLVYCFTMAKRGTSNIGHNAHFWGAIYGIIFTLFAISDSGARFLDYLKGVLDQVMHFL